MKEAGAGVLNSHAYLDHFVRFNFERPSTPEDYRCYSGYTTLYIDADLNLRSCWSGGMPLIGNLRRDCLRRLLDSSRMRAARRKIRKLECERCWLLCTAEISLRWQ
jgi:sulfatase maturation enzyme AslB (radical SAM superfamily)